MNKYAKYPSWMFTPEDFYATTTKAGLDKARAFCAYIAAENANAKLKEWIEASQLVYGRKNFGGYHATSESDDTHTARLICIEPIETDTAEDLVKEFAEYEFDFEVSKRFREMVERAKKLLNKKEQS